MARPCTGGQRSVVLSASERRTYMRWWLDESGLSDAEIVDLAVNLYAQAGARGNASEIHAAKVRRERATSNQS